jgi:hypothetical protein
MELQEYFNNRKGVGVLSTSDSDGKVGAAIYGHSHIMEDGAVAFIMRDRLSLHNLQSNPHAAFLFMEEGKGYKGKRIFLTKIREEKETELLQSLHRRCISTEEDLAKGPKYLVFFRLDKELPLLGAGEEGNTNQAKQAS